jgi:hypothetical protein
LYCVSLLSRTPDEERGHRPVRCEGAITSAIFQVVASGNLGASASTTRGRYVFRKDGEASTLGEGPGFRHNCEADDVKRDRARLTVVAQLKSSCHGISISGGGVLVGSTFALANAFQAASSSARHERFALSRQRTRSVRARLNSGDVALRARCLRCLISLTRCWVSLSGCAPGGQAKR